MKFPGPTRQTETSASRYGMSVQPPGADVVRLHAQVRSVPNSEVARFGVATLIHDVGASPQSHIGRSEK